MKEKSQQRKLFEKTAWKIGSDGLWLNPNADLNCKKCNGFGVLDDGGLAGAIFINCKYCWKNEN